MDNKHYSSPSPLLASVVSELKELNNGNSPHATQRATCFDNNVADWSCISLQPKAANIKRLMDVIISFILFSLLTPILIIIATAIRLESSGPIIFRQWRFGEAGQRILVLKFRTMYIEQCDFSGETRTRQRDPRVTYVGRLLRRTSMDELPQLINVIRGDMSLIGPRAHPITMRVEGRYYFDVVEGYHRRHCMKPGITGWAQVNGSRGEVASLVDASNRFAFDLFYVQNWSIWLDLLILWRTASGAFFTESD